MFPVLWLTTLLTVFQQSTDRPFRTLDRGPMSAIDSPRQVTARTSEEWSALWRAHAPGRPAPQVDLANEMVVGVFAGTKPTGGYAVEITRAEERDGALVIEYRESSPPADAVAAQVLTAPYHLIVLPRDAGPVRFRQVRDD